MLSRNVTNSKFQYVWAGFFDIYIYVEIYLYLIGPAYKHCNK